MKANRLLAVTTLMLAGMVAVHASDPVGVYARVEKIVMEPNDQAPERIQVWGAFSIAAQGNPNDYEPSGRGYLYFALPANAALAVSEWRDLKAVAGTGQIVAFGTRYGGRVRLRKADERPESPDKYSMNVGVKKVNGRTDYAPIRSLVELKP
jgi:hypothetical protein